MSLGQRIRELRQSRGLTQSQLGGVELSKSFISLLEKDRARPSIDTLQLIARRLGASVDALLGQDDKTPDLVCAGLLALSRGAIRNGDLGKASKLLETVGYLAETHRIGEASCEAQLQIAEIAVEQRRFAEASSVLAQTLAASEQAKDMWRVGRALYLMGLINVRQREFPKALRLLEKALVTLRRARAGRDPIRVEALITLGTTLWYMGDFVDAIGRFQEAARSQIAQTDPVVRGKANWGIGQSYRKMGNPDAALEYLLKAKDDLESAEDLPDRVRVLKAVGQVLYERGRPREALRYLHQALRAVERLRMEVIRASTLTEIARVHFDLGNLEEALHFATQALQQAKGINDPVEVAEASVILARISREQKDTTRAIALLKDAIESFQQRQMKAKLAETARELGMLLRERGAHAQAAAYLALSLEASKSESSSGNPVAAQADD